MIGPEVQGSTVHIMRGTVFSKLTPPKPANDNVHERERAVRPNTVTVRRRLEKSDVEVKVKVPVSEYVGVAISTKITEDGVLSSAINLIHDDADLNYQVFEEVGNDNVVAEWQNWGRKLRLPLFIRAGDGQLMPYSQHVDGVMLGQMTARRKTMGEANRRPRFLNRRKLGGSNGA